MPTTYDSFVQGVPDTRTGMPRSMFDQNPMSSSQRYSMSQQRMAATSAILETRDRMEQLREAERTRIEAPRALNALRGLDPVNDPDYGVKVADILAQNPAAALDRTVDRFLGVQGKLFDQADGERRAAARAEADAIEWERRKQITLQDRVNEDRRRIRADRVEDAKSEEKAASAAKIKKAESEIAQLPQSYQTRIMQVAEEEGVSPVDVYSKNKAKYLNDMEIDSLVEGGVSLDRIQGTDSYPGILDENGFVDPVKKRKLVDEVNREKAQREAQEEDQKTKKAKLERAERLLESDDDRPFLSEQQRANLENERAKLAREIAGIPEDQENVAADPNAPASSQAPASGIEATKAKIDSLF